MKKTKIVIADDMEPILIYLEKVLSSVEEFEIVGKALTGEELTHLVIKHKPDLVITDEQMPNCSGTMAIKKLNEMNIKTKYILITGYDDPLVNIQAKKLGALKVIKKPILDDKTFIKYIKESINDEYYLQQEVQIEEIVIENRQEETKPQNKNIIKDILKGIFKNGK